MREYYLKNPQLNRHHALATLKHTEERLRAFPESGTLYEDFESLREIRVLGTPFALLYTISGDYIFVIDVRDPRGNRSAEALRAFLRSIQDGPSS